MVKKYVVVRAKEAGCFAGFLESKQGQNVVLKKARRLWYWAGASTLSELATNGMTKPNNCKFPVPVEGIEIDGVVEVIDTTPQAQKCIEDVPVWTQFK